MQASSRLGGGAHVSITCPFGAELADHGRHGFQPRPLRAALALALGRRRAARARSCCRGTRSTVRAMAPILVVRVLVTGTRAPRCRPAASCCIMPASSSSGRVMERPDAPATSEPEQHRRRGPTTEEPLTHHAATRQAISGGRIGRCRVPPSQMPVRRPGSALLVPVRWVDQGQQRPDLVGAGDPLGEG